METVPTMNITCSDDQILHNKAVAYVQCNTISWPAMFGSEAFVSSHLSFWLAMHCMFVQLIEMLENEFIKFMCIKA